MNAVIPQSIRFGQKAHSACLLYTSKSLLRCLRAASSSFTSNSGDWSSEERSKRTKGARRLSAGVQRNLPRNQPPHRGPADEVDRNGKKTVFKQGDLQFYATCHPGLEEVTAKELGSQHVGAFDIKPGKAGVHFK